MTSSNRSHDKKSPASMPAADEAHPPVPKSAEEFDVSAAPNEPFDETVTGDKNVKKQKGQIKVQAIQAGYYAQDRKVEGDIFFIAKEEDFSDVWMQKV